MVYVQNTTKSVRVLKATGRPPLRLMPGFNQIENKKVLDDYVKSNVAAEAFFETGDLVVRKEVSPDDEKEGMDAKEKNDKLNKAYRVLEATNKKLIESSNKTNELESTVTKQNDLLEIQAEQIAELTARLDALDVEEDDVEEDDTEDEE